MASLMIVFVALIAVIGSSVKVESSSAQALDLNKILELVQKHRLNTGPSKPRTLQLQIISSDSDSDSDDSLTDSDESDDSDNNRFARLRKDRLVNLLTTAAKEETDINRLTYSKGNKNYGQRSDKSDDAENQRIAKERILNLIESVAKEKNNNNRLTYSKGKESYGQVKVKYDDSDNKRLESQKIIDLIESVANADSNRNAHISNRKIKPNNDQKSYLVRSEDFKNTQSINNNVQQQILEKLFDQASNVEERKKKPKKKLIANRLTPTVTMDDVKKYYEKQNRNKVEISKNNEVTGLEEYSKVYIVLNPQAVQNSKNKTGLKDLISKVLSLSSPNSKRLFEVEGMPRRYKNFVVKDNLPIRRFKTLNVELDDDDKNAPVAVPLGQITAVPT